MRKIYVHPAVNMTVSSAVGGATMATAEGTRK